MKATVTPADSRTVIRLSGRFDFNSHREFRDAVDTALQDASKPVVEVDLAEVDYLDSSALGMLLMLRDKARGLGRQVALANCGGAVKQVIEIANFSKLFAVS
jgi:anti-anti-sigma factor